MVHFSIKVRLPHFTLTQPEDETGCDSNCFICDDKFLSKVEFTEEIDLDTWSNRIQRLEAIEQNETEVVNEDNVKIPRESVITLWTNMMIMGSNSEDSNGNSEECHVLIS